MEALGRREGLPEPALEPVVRVLVPALRAAPELQANMGEACGAEGPMDVDRILRGVPSWAGRVRGAARERVARGPRADAALLRATAAAPGALGILALSIGCCCEAGYWCRETRSSDGAE